METMDALLAARAQMEVSLAFHMFFAALGIGLPLLMLIAEGLWLRTGRGHYRDLARTWAKATALTFAVGAVSGTALSFELGLLWPRFMEVAGPILGPAFALEGYAFFIEAIFLGLYLYGWDRLSPAAHWWTGVPVAVQEQNSHPGFTTRQLSRWAHQVHLGFPEAGLLLKPGPRTEILTLGNPIRPPEQAWATTMKFRFNWPNQDRGGIRKPNHSSAAGPRAPSRWPGAATTRR